MGSELLIDGLADPPVVDEIEERASVAAQPE
jgi:hypothetical protein